MWQKYRLIVLYLIVVLAITLPWFFKPGYIFLVDFVWGPHLRPDWTDNGFFWKVLVQSLGFLVPMALLQKLFLSGVLFAVLWGGKKIAGLFIDSPWLIFAISLFVLFNPFVYDRLLYGQVGAVFAYGLMLWATGFLLQYLREQRGGQIIKAGLLIGFSVQMSPHFMFFNGAIGILVLVLAVLRRQEIDWKRLLGYVFLAGAIVLLLNANWLYAAVRGNSEATSYVRQGITEQDLAVFKTAGRTGGEALRNVVMMSGFWGKDQFRYIDLTRLPNGWGRSFLILLPVILWGAYTGIRNKATRSLSLTLLLLYIIAVLLAVGIRLPVVDDVTRWLFDHAPFYKGLRETQKWVAVEILVYLVFLAWGARQLSTQAFVRTNRVIITGLLVAVIVMQAPLLLWGFRGQAKPVQYPSDWYEANQFLQQIDNDCQGNILFLPWHLYMRFNFIGNVVANPANQFFPCKTYQGTNMEFGGIYSNSTDPASKLIEPWLTQQGKTGLLDGNRLNIRYVILGKELDWRNYSWLNNDPQLKLIKDSSTLRIYQVR